MSELAPDRFDTFLQPLEDYDLIQRIKDALLAANIESVEYLEDAVVAFSNNEIIELCKVELHLDEFDASALAGLLVSSNAQIQQPTTVFPKSNITQMLTSVTGIPPDPKIVQLMIEHYAVQANLWLLENNVHQLRELYKTASAYPKTSTKRLLKADGFYLNGPYQSYQNVFLGFRDTVPILVKIVVNEEEITRIQILSAAIQSLQIHPSIAPFSIYGTPSKNRLMMIMTPYPATLKSLVLSTVEMNSRFLDQMIGALQFLHDINFAHMDIKPTNIAIDYSGNFILIDLGSTCEIGGRTESTEMFVPKDIKDNDGMYISSANTDFWMLAATLYSKHNEIMNRVSKNNILTFFANEGYFDPLRNLLA